MGRKDWGLIRSLDFTRALLIICLLLGVVSMITHGGSSLVNRFYERQFVQESRLEWTRKKLHQISVLRRTKKNEKGWCESGLISPSSFSERARRHNHEVDHYARVALRYAHGIQYRGVEETLPQKVHEYCRPPRRQIL